MTTFTGSPRLLKAGLVLIDPDTSVVQRIVALQYNPETLTRTLQARRIGDGGARGEVLRLTGPPVETISLEAEIDATDQMEFPDDHPATAQMGIYPQLAALEAIVYPASGRLITNNGLAQAGTLEIAPMEGPLTLFVWSERRVLPVLITDLSVTEEAFDPALNPIRATVRLGLRVLSVNDLGFDHKGGSLFMVYHQQLEQLAGRNHGASLTALGIRSIP